MTRAAPDERYRLAAELIDDAEDLVQAAERAVEGECDPRLHDIAETQLREALELQDEIAEEVAPTIERRRREVTDAARAAVRSLQGAPGVDWAAKYRPPR